MDHCDNFSDNGEVIVDKIVIFDFDGVLCRHTMEPTPYHLVHQILPYLHSRGWRIMIASFNEDALNLLSSWGYAHMIHDARCGGYSKPNQIISLLISSESGWSKNTKVFFFDDDTTNICEMDSLSLIVSSTKIDPDIGISWQNVHEMEKQ